MEVIVDKTWDKMSFVVVQITYLIHNGLFYNKEKNAPVCKLIFIIHMELASVKNKTKHIVHAEQGARCFRAKDSTQTDISSTDTTRLPDLSETLTRMNLSILGLDTPKQITPSDSDADKIEL